MSMTIRDMEEQKQQQQQQQQHLSPSLLSMKVGRERCECEGDRQCCSLGMSVLNRRSNIRFLLLAALVVSSALVAEFRGPGGESVIATAMESAVNMTARFAKSMSIVNEDVRKMEGLMSSFVPTSKTHYSYPPKITTTDMPGNRTLATSAAESNKNSSHSGSSSNVG